MESVKRRTFRSLVLRTVRWCSTSVDFIVVFSRGAERQFRNMSAPSSDSPNTRGAFREVPDALILKIAGLSC